MDNGTISQNYKDRQDNSNSYTYLKVIKLSMRTSRLLLAHFLVTPERRLYPWLTLDCSGSRRAMQGEDDTGNA